MFNFRTIADEKQLIAEQMEIREVSHDGCIAEVFTHVMLQHKRFDEKQNTEKKEKENWCNALCDWLSKVQ